MPNVIRADCGFDPHDQDKFYNLTIELLNGDEALDLAGHTNMEISLASESADVEIPDFVNMVNGKTYRIVASNGASTKNQLLFPSSTLMNGTVTATDGMTVVYTFFTDGYSIYCNQAIYA